MLGGRTGAKTGGRVASGAPGPGPSQRHVRARGAELPRDVANLPEEGDGSRVLLRLQKAKPIRAGGNRRSVNNFSHC
eukprot:422521-Pyramimonas_sp.AAC.1